MWREWCFANALFLEILDVPAAAIDGYAKDTVGTQIAKNRAYLRSKPEVAGGLKSVGGS